MQTPLISVIIPVYNVEAYLPRCLDSVIQNTYRNLEIICVDDGSTDGSPEILRDYAQRDARITLITKENGGVSSARNAGLNRMTGEFVSFVDSDDFVHLQIFETFSKALIETNADMIIGNYSSFSDANMPENAPSIVFDRKDLHPLTCMEVFKNYYLGSFCWGRIFRKTIVEELRFNENLSFAEDSAFNVALWEHSPNMNCWLMDYQVYHYFSRVNAVTKTVPYTVRLNTIQQHFRNADAALPENVKQLWLVKAVCVSLRFLNYYSFKDYSSIGQDHNAVKMIAREVRKHTGKVICSSAFSTREKLFFCFKFFFPFLRSKMVIIKNKIMLRKKGRT